jgi:hypothetical protein
VSPVAAAVAAAAEAARVAAKTAKSASSAALTGAIAAADAITNSSAVQLLLSRYEWVLGHEVYAVMAAVVIAVEEKQARVLALEGRLYADTVCDDEYRGGLCAEPYSFCGVCCRGSVACGSFLCSGSSVGGGDDGGGGAADAVRAGSPRSSISGRLAAEELSELRAKREEARDAARRMAEERACERKMARKKAEEKGQEREGGTNVRGKKKALGGRGKMGGASRERKGAKARSQRQWTAAEAAAGAAAGAGAGAAAGAGNGYEAGVGGEDWDESEEELGFGLPTYSLEERWATAKRRRTAGGGTEELVPLDVTNGHHTIYKGGLGEAEEKGEPRNLMSKGAIAGLADVSGGRKAKAKAKAKWQSRGGRGPTTEAITEKVACEFNKLGFGEFGHAVAYALHIYRHTFVAHRALIQPYLRNHSPVTASNSCTSPHVQSNSNPHATLQVVLPRRTCGESIVTLGRTWSWRLKALCTWRAKDR